MFFYVNKLRNVELLFEHEFVTITKAIMKFLQGLLSFLRLCLCFLLLWIASKQF